MRIIDPGGRIAEAVRRSAEALDEAAASLEAMERACVKYDWKAAEAHRLSSAANYEAHLDHKLRAWQLVEGAKDNGR